MAWSRLSGKLLASYLTVILLCLALFLPRLMPWEEEAVPALGGTSSPVGEAPAWVRLSLMWGCPPLFAHGARGGADPVPALLAGGRDGLSSLIRTLVGIDWPRPASMMALTMPSLFGRDAESLPAVTVAKPVLYLPSPVPPSGGDPPPSGEEVLVPPGGTDSWPPPDEPLVVIYHTHTQESFLPVLGLGPGAAAERAFSADPSLNMLAVGEILARELSAEHGIGVIHVLEYFDRDEDGRMGRLGAYARAETYMSDLVGRYPGAPILIDLHRDSPRLDRTLLEDPAGDYARILLVVGSDQRLEHPAWRRNLSFAGHLASALETIRPGITRGVEPHDHRYNQHLSPAAILVELGGVDNTMDQVERSVRVLAQAIRDTVLSGVVPGLTAPAR